MAENDNTPLKPEELQNFLRQYTPENRLVRERDVLSERYRINPGEPLPQFSSSMANAFAARDQQAPDQQVYALVFESTAMPRKKNIAALKDFRHPNMVSLIADGIVEISTYGESRYVVILERPIGQPLSELLQDRAQKNPVSENTVVNYLLRPFTEILKSFASMGISHNRINLKNVYIHNSSLQLGECISDTSGFSQDFMFEPLDRLLTAPYGKADYAIDADCYATALLALHLIIGFQPFAGVTKEDFTASMLSKGSYHTLVIQWDISEQFQDLFRALLNDSKRDRCAPEHMENWLGGRRFNLILPSISQETARGFEFGGQIYYNRKMLAHALFLNWVEARAVLFDTRLPRWLETSLHKKEIAEGISRIASNSLGDTPKAEKQNNELLSRIIMALDPSGPIRYRTLSFMPDGVGNMLAHFYFSANKEELQTAIQALESDLSANWFEQQKTSTDYSSETMRLQKMRAFLRMRSPGFGIERSLYDTHPSLSCQSPLVKKLNITSLRDMFFALDTLAPQQRATETDFMDTHISAFIASRLELSKEIRIHELDDIPELASNPNLVSLKLLMRTQHAIGGKPAKGLSHWVALRLFKMPDFIHRRQVRHQMQRSLQDAAATGSMAAIAQVLMNSNIFVSDYVGFKKAVSSYASRKYQIAKLQDPRERSKHARMVGRGLAQTLAYGTSLFTVYFTLRAYYNI